jgi:hypothetical protein
LLRAPVASASDGEAAAEAGDGSSHCRLLLSASQRAGSRRLVWSATKELKGALTHDLSPLP